MFVGSMVGWVAATAGGAVLFVKLFKKIRRGKRAKIERKARTIAEDVLLDRDVRIGFEVEVFARSLGEALSGLPAATPLP
jgi:hypothetical protein